MTTLTTMNCSWTNFRDLGGLDCKGGKRIKPGKIFRSPVLVPETSADQDFLDSLNLSAILDLRTPGEVKEKQDYVPAGCEYINLPVYSAKAFPHLPVSRNAQIKTILLRGKHVDDPVEEKRRSYQRMPFAKEPFFRLFTLMDEGKTFVFHCTAGKDRTGICAMLIEFALGRTYQQILTEYVRSDEINPPRRRERLRYFGCSQKLIDNIHYCEGVHAELLDLSLNSMLEKYGSPEEFLLKEYGVTSQRIAKWKEIYLD